MHFLIERKVNLPLEGRLKFIYLFFVLSLVLISASIPFHAIVLSFHLTLLLLFRIPKKELLKAYIEPLFVAFMLLLIKSVSLFPFAFYPERFAENLSLATRVLSAFTLFLLIFYSFSFTELLQTLHSFRFPSLLVELMLLTHRFILLLYDEFLTIYYAQRNRLGFCGIRTYARSVKAVTHALFFKTLEHGENAIMSMRQRGYDFKNLFVKKTEVRPLEIVYLSGMMVVWLTIFLILQGWL
jgi:cobalt/nickel transport system permease protein